jgi:hypothetical protein
VLLSYVSYHPDLWAKSAANLANNLYHWMHFYVNNPKIDDENFSSDFLFYFFNIQNRKGKIAPC